MIILHYTAGVSAQSSPRYLARPDVKASAHLGRLAWTAGRFVAECGREVELEQVFVDV